MAPPRNDQLGERISGVEATLETLDKYQHERWHELNNRLQPLFGLPEQLAREVGRMQGSFEGRIGAVTKELERSITAAVEKAMEPVSTDIADLKSRVGALETVKEQEAGAKGVIAAVLKSPAVAWLFAAAVALWALITGKVPA